MSISTYDLHWAAGFMEGEGSFLFHENATAPRVDCAQVQAQPVERLQTMFGGTLYKRWPGKAKGWQEQNYWMCYSAPAIGIMMTLYPLMSPRRQEQIRSVIEKWKAKPMKKRYSPRRPKTSLCNKEDI